MGWAMEPSNQGERPQEAPKLSQAIILRVFAASFAVPTPAKGRGQQANGSGERSSVQKTSKPFGDAPKYRARHSLAFCCQISLLTTLPFSPNS